MTKTDKVLLLQTLYVHADPNVLGRAEYLIRDLRGELVSGIPIAECKMILERSKADMPGANMLDYHSGKTIKLVFFTKRNGEIVTDSTSYDERNGKFRFLEALLNVFDVDEILITKKVYEIHHREYLNDKTPHKEADQLLEFMSMLKYTDKVKNERGSYWKFDRKQVSYRPPFI